MNEKLTLEKLMKDVGCSVYPERWSEIFDAAMKEYDVNGCKMVTQEFYDDLNEKYGCFEEFGYVYSKAISYAKDDEMLCRFVVLLSMALNDEEHKKEDFKQFKRPITPEGKAPEAYEMATALALCSQFDGCAAMLRKRGIPQKYINSALTYAAKGVRNYIWRHNGAIGYDLLSWAQLYIQGELYPIQRLEMQFFAKFVARAIVFQNEKGETIPLAHDLEVHRSGYALGSYLKKDEEGSFLANVEEDDEYWIGHPYADNGLVQKEKIKLAKTEWKKVLEKGDPIISVHIPPEGKLTKELLDKTIQETKEFAAKYYPDFKYKAFACHSWLMSTQLDDMLGADSNIVKFSQRFRRMTCKSSAEAVFSFVFLKPDMNFEIKDLPENTSLERVLKEKYLNGDALYEMHGYFFA